MARVCNSLTPPDQGYPHRDHRAKKNRTRNFKDLQVSRKRKQTQQINREAEIYDEQMQEAREDFI